MLEFLNRPLSKNSQVLIILALLALPVLYVLCKFDPRTRFTSLIFFGPAFDERALPEVRAVPHAFAGKVGYDGQFYAQLAVDPALRSPDLPRALDNPSYRAKRILVPALCWLAGGGRPWLVIQIYAVINLLFFALLLAAMVRFLRPATLQHFLGVAAAMWTTGTLVSVERALLDLPGTALTFLAAGLSGLAGFSVFAAAMLTRESSLLSLPAVLWPRDRSRKKIGRLLLGAAVAMVPYFLWGLYVDHVFHSAPYAPRHVFGMPLVSFFRHLGLAASSFTARPNANSIFEILAPISLGAQVIYLLAKPRPASAYWRMGVVFAVLFFFLSDAIFVEQAGYCRILLPLTVAFNVLVVQERRQRFSGWFVAGNVGLIFEALRMARALFH